MQLATLAALNVALAPAAPVRAAELAAGAQVNEHHTYENE